MFSRKTSTLHFHKSIRIVSVLVVVAFLLSFLSLVSAKNYSPSGGCKAINCIGYKCYYDTTNSREVIEVFFDKQLSSNFNSGMITVTRDSDGVTLATSTTTGTYRGWTAAYAPVGASIAVFGTGSPTISFSTEYTVKLSSCILSNNSTGINLGDYNGHNDISFKVFTPQAINNTYASHTAQFTYLPCNPNGAVGESANSTIISDIPITGTVDLSQVYLDEDTDNDTNHTYETRVGQDSDHSAKSPIAGDQSYVAEANTANTAWFLPMTIGRTDTAWYNYDVSTPQLTKHYRLHFPDILKNSNGTNYAYFTTGQATPVSVGSASPAACAPIVVSHSANSVTLQWTDIQGWEGLTNYSGITPSYYRVYYSVDNTSTVRNEKYFGFDENVAEGIASYNGSGVTTTFEVTGLAAGFTYYFRYVAVYDSDLNDGYTWQEGGFSDAASYTL